jgi:hypothetical protein
MEFYKSNMEFLQVLTKWCTEHKVQFTGKESSVIDSAQQEFSAQQQSRIANLESQLKTSDAKVILNYQSAKECEDKIKELEIDRSNILAEKNQKLSDCYDEIDGLKRSCKTQESNADYWKTQYNESILAISDLQIKVANLEKQFISSEEFSRKQGTEIRELKRKLNQ